MWLKQKKRELDMPEWYAESEMPMVFFCKMLLDIDG